MKNGCGHALVALIVKALPGSARPVVSSPVSKLIADRETARPAATASGTGALTAAKPAWRCLPNARRKPGRHRPLVLGSGGTGDLGVVGRIPSFG
ncbi:MAG: hypothetical protein EBE86_023245 [Hormoscilla sp. GUM202]|nr:hypothetical protein [Hormoscilla sp. GUM202]